MSDRIGAGHPIFLLSWLAGAVRAPFPILPALLVNPRGVGLAKPTKRAAGVRPGARPACGPGRPGTPWPEGGPT